MKIRDTQAYIKNLIGKDYSGHIGAPTDPLFIKLFGEGGVDYLIENISGFAKDIHTQVFYELIQNASDAHATHFTIFFDNHHFIAVNNGNPFLTDGTFKGKGRLRSFLAKNKGVKKEDSIGKHGQGSKLMYDLLASANKEKQTALKESLLKDLNGLILFSWSNISALNQFLYWEGDNIKFEKKYDNVDTLLLTKIIYTYYPSFIGEQKCVRNGKEKLLFDRQELTSCINFIKSTTSKFNISDFQKGTLIYAKLGNGRAEKLQEALNDNLKSGIKTSLAVLPRVERVKINDLSFKKEIHFTEIPLNLDLRDSDKKPFNTRLIIPDSLENISAGLSNFFQYFPITESNHGLKYIIDSTAYRIEGSRQSIDYEDIDNQNKLSHISEKIENYYASLVVKNKIKKAIKLINSILATNSNKISQEPYIEKLFFTNILKAINKSIPTNNGLFVDCKHVIKQKTAINIDLSKLGYSDTYWLHDDINDKEQFLEIKAYDISKVIKKAPNRALCNQWILGLTQKDYAILFNEVNQKIDLPFVKVSNNTVCSIEDIKNNKNFIPLDARTKGIKKLLLKKGILLCGGEFEISTGIEDSQLFERLNTLFDFTMFSKDEKWNLFRNYQQHFKKLEEDTLSTTLKLFTNHKGQLKPLSKLLPEDNTQTGILKPYKLNPIEHNQHLIGDFLMKEKKVWKNLIKDWEKLRQRIVSKDFDSIVKDLENIYNKAADKDKSIKFQSDTICIKSTSGNWIAPDNLFFNTNLTELNSVDYDRLSVLTKKLSDYQMLDNKMVDSIGTLKFYELGNKGLSAIKSKLKAKYSKVSLTGQDLQLLYKVKRSKETFFNHFTINGAQDEYKLEINDAKKKQYYSTDNLLNSFLVTKKKYACLPPELYAIFTKDSSLKTLRQDFIEDLIEDLGAAEAFVDIVSNAGNQTQQLYLKKTTEVNFDSKNDTKSYRKNYLGKIVRIIVAQKQEEKFKDKIYINNKKLKTYTVQDEILLLKGKHLFKLTEISRQKIDKGLSVIKDRLNGINTGNLFDQEPYPIADLVKEISNSENITIPQLIFLLVAVKDEGARDFIKKKTFSDLNYSKIDQINLLQKLCSKEITWFENYLKDNFFEPSLYVYTDNKKLILEEEKVPSWVENWLNDQEKNNKVKFLIQCDLSTELSPVVRLREAIYKNEPVDNKQIERAAYNLQQVNQTLKWVTKRTENQFGRNSQVSNYENFKTLSYLISTCSTLNKKLPDFLLLMSIYQQDQFQLEQLDTLKKKHLRFIYHLPSSDYRLVQELHVKHKIRLTNKGHNKEYRKLLEDNGIKSLSLKKKPSFDLQKHTLPFDAAYYKVWKQENEDYEILQSSVQISSQYSINPEGVLLGEYPSDVALFEENRVKKIIVHKKQGKSTLDYLSEYQEELFGSNKDKLVQLLALANQEKNQFEEIAAALKDSPISKDDLPELLQQVKNNQLNLKEALNRLNSQGEGGIDLGDLTPEQENRLKESIDAVNKLLEKLGSKEKLERLLEKFDDIEKMLEEEDDSSTPNQIIGHIGEVLIIEWLKLKGLNVEHVSVEYENGQYKRATYTPYDISLKMDNGIEYLIDVKTTIRTIRGGNKSIPFYISQKEYQEIMINQWDNYFIIRISLLDLKIDSIYRQIQQLAKGKDFDSVLKKYHPSIERVCQKYLSVPERVKHLEKEKKRFKVAIPKLTDDVPF